MLKISPIFRIIWKSHIIKAITLALVVLAFGRSEHLDAGQWASWVQAIGGIAAVIAALLLGTQQSEAAAKLAARQSADTITAIEYSARLSAESRTKGLVLLLETVFNYAEDCYISFQDGRDAIDFAVHADRIPPISGLISALDEISYIEMVNPEGIQNLINLRYQIADLRNKLQSTAEHFRDPLAYGYRTAPVTEGISNICLHVQRSVAGILSAVDHLTFLRLERHRRMPNHGLNTTAVYN